MIDKNTLRQFLRSNPFPTKLGDITITREIGEGANGLVYEGVLNGNPVAVKFLVEAHSQKLTRFKAEFFNVLLLPINQFVARPLFYDELQLPETSFPGIVLQKYDGNLQRPHNPTKETLRSLTEFLLNALNFIHSHGIIHRDIKPANILVDGKDYALADFGIASYNPDLFHLKAETKSEERLANRLFSAPEQEDGGIQAHATMDIYALGQVIQWFVTGSVHRGTKRTRISSVLPDSDEYDFVVDRCLANDPSSRFQSISDLRKAVSDFHESRKKNDELDDAFIDPFDRYLYPFADAVAAMAPKHAHGVIFIDERNRIDRFLQKLSEHDFDTHLWWTDGTGDMYFGFTPLSDGIWLMGDGKSGDEVRVKSVWLAKSPSVYGDVVLLTMEPMSPFGIYEKREIDMTEYDQIGLTPSEEAGLIDGEYYVTRAEFDNGYAEIDGEVIDLSEHSSAVRTRYLTSYCIFIGTSFHNVLQMSSEQSVRTFIRAHRRGEGITEKLFAEFADSIRRNIHRNVLNLL